MSRETVRRVVRLTLFAILVGLLLYAWITDRPSPAYPQGQFGTLVGFTLVIVGLAALIVYLFRSMRK